MEKMASKKSKMKPKKPEVVGEDDDLEFQGEPMFEIEFEDFFSEPVRDPVEEPAPQLVSVHDMARQNIKGYKETWWPSIKKMSDSEAIGEYASFEECKMLFRKWGAELK
jgi:hypothetical protein